MGEKTEFIDFYTILFLLNFYLYKVVSDVNYLLPDVELLIIGIILIVRLNIWLTSDFTGVGIYRYYASRCRQWRMNQKELQATVSVGLRVVANVLPYFYD